MLKPAFLALAAAAALAATAISASAQMTTTGSGYAYSGIYAGLPSGPDHGMPEGTAGGDGPSYMGAPDVQAAISLVTAGGAPGHFSIAAALTSLAGPKLANAEIAKLSKQYGKARFDAYVAGQNYAVNDAVSKLIAAGVKFPKPTMHGTALAKKVVMLGLFDGTYYEGYALDHLITHKVHEAVMNDVDAKFGKAADANYHAISDQAHYDLAQALGATSVKLAAYH